VQGLGGVNGELARELKHELTHSFVGQKTNGRAPTWVQEGVAQYMEGSRSSEFGGQLLEALSQPNAPQLQALEGPWMALDQNSAHFAYAWSLAVIESIVDAGGLGDVNRLLDKLATDNSTEAALHDALRCDYTELEQQTVAYLRRNYVR
jgi:hypothetical protein